MIVLLYLLGKRVNRSIVSVALAVNGGVSTSTNSIHFPVSVVIVHHVKISMSTPALFIISVFVRLDNIIFHLWFEILHCRRGQNSPIQLLINGYTIWSRKTDSSKKIVISLNWRRKLKNKINAPKKVAASLPIQTNLSCGYIYLHLKHTKRKRKRITSKRGFNAKSDIKYYRGILWISPSPKWLYAMVTCMSLSLV